MEQKNIKIEKILAEEISTPENNGTPGSGLYSVPFKLSDKPSEIWRDAFIGAWDRPEKYTSMHRPGIAGVSGDKIYLDGTTIEEVEEYHKETLERAVAHANAKEKEYLEKRQLAEKQEKDRSRIHKERVTEAAKRIKF